MTEFLRVKDWEGLQHYKDRNPPWIKLHRSVLDDYKFSCLQDASKAHLMLLWVLASQLNNQIPNDSEWLNKRLNLRTKINLKELIDNGFLILEQDASTTIAKCSPETEAETDIKKLTKKEISHDENFEKFFTRFPSQRKGSRDKARPAWDSAIKRDEPEIILRGLEAYLASSDVAGGFAKGAAAWLNDDGWKNNYRPPQASPASKQPMKNVVVY